MFNKLIFCLCLLCSLQVNAQDPADIYIPEPDVEWSDCGSGNCWTITSRSLPSPTVYIRPSDKIILVGNPQIRNAIGYVDSMGRVQPGIVFVFHKDERTQQWNISLDTKNRYKNDLKLDAQLLSTRTQWLAFAEHCARDFSWAASLGAHVITTNSADTLPGGSLDPKSTTLINWGDDIEVSVCVYSKINIVFLGMNVKLADDVSFRVVAGEIYFTAHGDTYACGLYDSDKSDGYAWETEEPYCGRSIKKLFISSKKTIPGTKR